MRRSIQIVWAMIIVVSVTPIVHGAYDELLKLTASDGDDYDRFSGSVSVWNDIAIVGAYRNDDAGPNTGSAYLFNATTGEELFKLMASDAAADDQFGYCVGVSGDVAIVGAYRNDDAGDISGSTYLYDTSTGTERFKLTASDAAAGDGFGRSVAISGGHAVIGAWGDDDKGENSGSVYVFDVATGGELRKLTASDGAAEDYFGEAVAISGNRAIVGAWYDDDAGEKSGSAYVFDVTSGQELFKLTASDAAAGDVFGHAVSIHGNIAVIGSYADGDAGDQSGAAYVFDITTGKELLILTASDAAAGDRFGISTGVNDDIAVIGAFYDGDAGPYSGSAYVFDLATGVELAKLTASDAAGSDEFGKSVAVSGDLAIIGAWFDDDKGPSSGSAYLYDVPEPTTLSLLALGGLALVRRRKRLRNKESRTGTASASSISILITVCLLTACSTGSAAVTFFTDEAAWLAGVENVQQLTTDANGIAMSNEVSAQPAVGETLGEVLTFDSLNTGLSWSFQLATTQEDYAFVFKGSSNLAIGQLSTYDNDDWEIDMLGGPDLRGFAFTLGRNDTNDDETGTLGSALNGTDISPSRVSVSG